MKKRPCLLVLVFLCSVGSFCVLVYVHTCPNSRCVVDFAPAGAHDQARTLLSPSDSPRRCPDGGEMVYEKYCVMKYWRSGERPDSGKRAVTLSTQGTAEFLYHVTTLCDRWQGPISVAVYFWGAEEFSWARRAVDTLRLCSSCVRHWVDWHLFFEESNRMPPVEPSGFPLECGNGSETKMKPSTGWKRRGGYPINVGRNIARRNTGTPYVFASDIELYPSEKVLERFEQMLLLRNASEREVFVLPVFEVYSRFLAPRTKEMLRYMYHRKQAVSFHKYRCSACHKIPNLPKWMNLTSANLPDGQVQPLRVWTTVRREPRFGLQYWEPFFIGTRRDPEFDPRLSWEGKQNKMQVAFAMCLMGYDFHILDEAFLVHAPGVNVYNSAKERFRAAYITENDRAMRTIKKELLRKHDSSKHKC